MKAVTVSNLRSHSASSSSSRAPMVMKPSSSLSHTALRKLTQDRMSLTLRMQRRPKSCRVSHSMKSSINSAISPPAFESKEMTSAPSLLDKCYFFVFFFGRAIISFILHNSLHSLCYTNCCHITGSIRIFSLKEKQKMKIKVNTVVNATSKYYSFTSHAPSCLVLHWLLY